MSSQRRTRNKTAKKRTGGDWQSWWSSSVNTASAPASDVKPVVDATPSNNAEIQAIKNEIQQLTDRVDKLEKSSSPVKAFGEKAFGGKSKAEKTKKRLHKK
jgi:hypothetical protein